MGLGEQEKKNTSAQGWVLGQEKGVGGAESWV